MRLSDIKEPICAICCKNVDLLEWHEDFNTNKVIFIAYCHGDKEIASFDKMLFFEDIQIIISLAFNKGLRYLYKNPNHPPLSLSSSDV